MSINVKIQSMSTITKNNRRVSPLATLNKDLVKQLCDLHPWDLKELCAQARLDQTVLSHFFAGRRPLPAKFAVAFLKQIGLRSDGEFDSEHCFVLKPALGMETKLTGLLGLLFPHGGKKIDLSTEWINKGKAKLLPGEMSHGCALFDGGNTAVIHDNDLSDIPLVIPGDWNLVDYDNSAELLLSLNLLPKKSDVLASFAAADLEAPDINWESVRTQASSMGFTPNDVLQILKSKQET